jgi:hypothetical protein
MKKLTLMLVFALLAGCAAVVKVEGEQVVKDRLAITLPEAWNKLNQYGAQQPYETWTQEGAALDQLRFWAGVQPGQPMMVPPPGRVPAGQTAPRVPTFAAGMAPDQLVNLFELLYSADGSRFKATRIDTSVFAGEKGVRFEFTLARKRDDLHLHGVGWVAVRNNELFAATFVAPELAYWRRLVPKAEAVVTTARIRS